MVKIVIYGSISWVHLWVCLGQRNSRFAAQLYHGQTVGTITMRGRGENEIALGRGGRPWGVGRSLYDMTNIRPFSFGFRVDCFRFSLLFVLLWGG